MTPSTAAEVDYDVLVHLEKDETGQVAALESNMAAFNRLQVRRSPTRFSGGCRRCPPASCLSPWGP